MTDPTAQYNYDVFKPENYERLMHWDQSPPVGQEGPDFSLWHLNGSETSLSALWSEQSYLVVEFGSFT